MHCQDLVSRVVDKSLSRICLHKFGWVPFNSQLSKLGIICSLPLYKNKFRNLVFAKAPGMANRQTLNIPGRKSKLSTTTKRKKFPMQGKCFNLIYPQYPQLSYAMYYWSTSRRTHICNTVVINLSIPDNYITCK